MGEPGEPGGSAGRAGTGAGRRAGAARRTARLAAALGAAALLPLPLLEVLPEGDGVPRLSRLAVPGHAFALEYRHSVFDAPVREQFRVDLRGRLVLAEIRSTRQDVIGYYHLPGATTRVARGEVVILPPAAPRERLRVRASGVGGRTFADGGCRVPLAGLAGEGGAVVLQVRYHPTVVALFGRSPACPSSRAVAATR